MIRLVGVYGWVGSDLLVLLIVHDNRHIVVVHTNEDV